MDEKQTAALREVLSDAAAEDLVCRVESAVGMNREAWDCIDAKEIVRAVLSDWAQQHADVSDAVRMALPEFCQQDDYLLAHGASLMSENSHEIIHLDTVRRIAAAVMYNRDGSPNAKPLDEYHEDFGPVAWFCWDAEKGEWLGEAAWIGRPDDSDWPGYHTHWIPHPPMPAALALQKEKQQ